MATKEAKTRAYKAQRERYKAMGLKQAQLWLDQETRLAVSALGSPREQNEGLKRALELLGKERARGDALDSASDWCV